MNPTLPVEQQILSICLNDPAAIREVAGIIKNPDTFLHPENKLIYGVMVEIDTRGQETELVSVHNDLTAKYGHLRGDAMGWMRYLTSLLPESNSFTGNLAKSCYWLVEQDMKTGLQRVLAKALVDIQSPMSDSFAISAELKTELDAIQGKLSSLTDKAFSIDLYAAVEIARAAAERGDAITGIKTLIEELDAYTKGLHPATVTIIAARTAMGKTAMLCQMGYNVAYRQNLPVAIFSLEMKRLAIARRMLAIDSEYKNGEVTSGMKSSGQPINIDRLFDSAGKIAGSPLFVFDSTTVRSWDHIKAKINQLVQKHPGIVIFIDYLQLIKSEDYDARTRVSRVSNEMKNLANINDIPIVALAQLNRNVEGRPDKRPQLSDLSESGSIEQDADTVAFLYRPAYYNKFDKKTKEENDPRLLLVILGKNRNGSTHNDGEAIHLDYDLATNRITGYAQQSL